MTAPSPPQVDREALRRLAGTVAAEAAALLLDGVDDVRSSIETKSTSTDVVTDMDRRSEALVVERLLAARPDDGLQGEEGADRAGTSGVRWVIDPLDGTTNYLYRLPGFGVSIAAQVEIGGGWRTVAGAIVDVVHGESYEASLGGGATCNGIEISVSGATDLSRALVATGFSYEAERRRRQAVVLAEVLPAVRDIRRMGAAAVDLCSVACGRVDAFYEKGLAPWDHAATSSAASRVAATPTSAAAIAATAHADARRCLPRSASDRRTTPHSALIGGSRPSGPAGRARRWARRRRWAG